MAVPRSVHALSAVLFGAAVLLSVAVGVAHEAVPSGVDGHVALAGIAVALTAAGAWQVDFRRGEHVEAVDLFEAALMPALLLFAGPIAVLVAVGAKLASQRIRRVSWGKAAFNVAQWGFATAVASAVFLSLRTPGEVDAGAIVPLLVATATAMVLSHLSVVVVLAVVRRLTPIRVLQDLGGVVTTTWVMGGVANLSLGLLFAAMTAWEPAASAVALVPLALYDTAHRASEATRADRRRLSHVQAATAALAAAIEPLRALPEVLEQVQRCFHSPRALLVDLDDRAAGGLGDLARLVADAEHIGRIRAEGPLVARLLDAAGLRDCLAAPVRRSGRAVAVLLVTDPGGLEGTEEGEVAVMGSFAAAIATAHQRHDATQATLAERRLLAQIFDTTSDGVMAIDADNRVVTWNPAMERLTGYGATEVARTDDLRILEAVDDHEAPVTIDFRDGLAAPLPDEIRIRTRQGNLVWLGCSHAVAPDTQRQSPLLVLTVRDITVARHDAQLQHEFVAIASHELRTPATVVQGMAQTLMAAGEAMTPEQRERAIRGVHRGAQRMHRVVTNVLAVARVEQGNKVPLASFGLGVVVDDALAEVCGETGLDVDQVDIDPRVRDLTVHANDSAVMQVLVNLIGNAVKYGDGQPIRIGTEVGEDTVSISVSDCGPGIPLHEQDRVFRRFERLHQHNMQAGTGLGLYISRKLAELCGGTLDLASAPGDGATFTLTLPAVAPDVDTCVAGVATDTDPLEIALLG